MPTSAHIFAGCYERFLFGFLAPTELDVQEPQTLVRKHTFAAHKHAVKCIAAAGPFLASGAADDTIHLYDILHDKDLGFLMNPSDGAVPCLTFFTPSPGAAATHLFSGSADGSISIWQAGGGWEHLKTMRGHKESVNSISVHNSGRLALSVARDSHIRMWNLLKGRCSYTAKLEVEGELVSFTPGGDAYALICGNRVTVHATSGEGGMLATLPHTRRVTCMAQTCDDVLMTGVEDGSVKVWDLRASSCSHTMERTHSSRVRGLAVLNAGTGKIPELFTTASSDGVVKVWDARMLSTSGQSNCMASGSTNARITCLCVVKPDEVIQAAKSLKQAAGVQQKSSQAKPATQQKQAGVKAVGQQQGSKAKPSVKQEAGQSKVTSALKAKEAKPVRGQQGSSASPAIKEEEMDGELAIKQEQQGTDLRLQQKESATRPAKHKNAGVQIKQEQNGAEPGMGQGQQQRKPAAAQKHSGSKPGNTSKHQGGLKSQGGIGSRCIHGNPCKQAASGPSEEEEEEPRQRRKGSCWSW